MAAGGPMGYAVGLRSPLAAEPSMDKGFAQFPEQQIGLVEGLENRRKLLWAFSS